MVPKIQATVEKRETMIPRISPGRRRPRARGRCRTRPRIARGWTPPGRSRRADPRSQAASARETEARSRPRPTRIAAKVDKAEAEIRAARDAARAEIEAVAVEATQDMVARLTGLKVPRDDAAEAVKADSMADPAHGTTAEVSRTAESNRRRSGSTPPALDRAGDDHRHRDHHLEEGAGGDRRALDDKIGLIRDQLAEAERCARKPRR